MYSRHMMSICRLFKSRSHVISKRTTSFPRVLAKQFSTTQPLNLNTLMETSGFTETQLDVREAIQKICVNYPDVGCKQDHRISRP